MTPGSGDEGTEARGSPRVEPAPWGGSDVRMEAVPWAEVARREAARRSEAEAAEPEVMFRVDAGGDAEDPGSEVAADAESVADEAPTGIAGVVGHPVELDAATEDDAESPLPAESNECPQCEITRAQAAAERQELIDTSVARYAASAQELGRTANEFAQRLSEDVVELALKLAGTVVQRVVELDRSVVIANLERALRIAGPVELVTIRCHPDDIPMLRSRAPDLASDLVGRTVEVLVQPGEDLELGDCMVLFDKGIVDARLDAELQHLGDAVRSAIVAHYSGSVDPAAELDDTDEVGG